MSALKGSRFLTFFKSAYARIGVGITALLAVAQYGGLTIGWPKDIWAFVPMCTAVFGWLALEIFTAIEETAGPKLSSHDERLFARFTEEIPHLAVGYCAGFPFALRQPFHQQSAEALYEFYCTWVGPGYEFRNSKLKHAFDNFSNAVASYFFVLRSFAVAGPAAPYHLYLTAPHAPNVTEEQISEMHDCAKKLREAYEAFLTEAQQLTS